MKTFVLWTHYDCEVYVTLHPTAEAAWENLKDGWLDECDEDCRHVLEDMSISEISSALEYHFEELNYDIREVEVPVEQMEITTERIENPVMVTDDQTYDLMSRLETFSEQP